MVEIVCVPVEAWHVEHVAEYMRAADVKECRVLGNLSPREALDLSLSHYGVSWTAMFNGEPAAIFGVVNLSLMGGEGIGWLLGTTILEKHWRAFARASRAIFLDVLKHYDRITNVTHVDNTLSMRWLAWLGATFQIHGQLARFEICASS